MLPLNWDNGKNGIFMKSEKNYGRCRHSKFSIPIQIMLLPAVNLSKFLALDQARLGIQASKAKFAVLIFNR